MALGLCPQRWNVAGSVQQSPFPDDACGVTCLMQIFLLSPPPPPLPPPPSLHFSPPPPPPPSTRWSSPFYFLASLGPLMVPALETSLNLALYFLTQRCTSSFPNRVSIKLYGQCFNVSFSYNPKSYEI